MAWVSGQIDQASLVGRHILAQFKQRILEPDQRQSLDKFLEGIENLARTALSTDVRRVPAGLRIQALGSLHTVVEELRVITGSFDNSLGFDGEPFGQILEYNSNLIGHYLFKIQPSVEHWRRYLVLL